MLFQIGKSIFEALEMVGGFYFVINGESIIPRFDDEACFVIVDGARFKVTYL